MTFGSLFAGIGGFDLGFERAGMRCVWQVENDPRKVKVLERHFPSAQREADIKEMAKSGYVDLVSGGDPCPKRSRARGNRPSKHPDLSGYFLAVVGRLRPQWVVRENVPAPDALHFAAALELLGYRIVALAFDSRDFTGQSRRRDYLCACLDHGAAADFERAVSLNCEHRRFSPSRSEEETPIAACLTAHGNRMAAEDTFCFEPGGRGLRVLSAEEAEALQGFPRGWTAGFPERRRRAMAGEAVTVNVVEWIGKRILESCR
jgi:DNA (cytosine-5)-methyltransferase 1